ncbi:tyrosine-protein phosphatase non-receptor type 21 [Aplysia californica]|uniref:protein-tyrosine-phosphatase n=1 Tax=Aplysia californica TaxID=6500 RepID=A0ABM1A3I9_APLCA|nr:tyrosine-protein phosphatase non-receptor type 21 [Aplysia californica]
MPFKWRLKKTRKYDISTKNLFIVGVYLLDNAYLECTLSAESTGQECLNSIAQRIELSESLYFGLRYVSKKLHFHWVDLEKPLKKQLDKYAQPASHSHCLYFGVMFYVIGAHKIPDEVARYHYYLQLKNDVMDGRLPCSVEQAIRLAAYSLQAEFGDYEPEKYSAEEYLLFPKTMMKDENTAAELLAEAIAGHESLKGVPPVRAELQYVKEVQMMDGYGAEYYSAKDESRKDLYLGTSHAGIFARYIDGQSTVYYKWAEIAKVTQNKKTLEIDTPKSSVQFQMEDTDTAKYVSRLAQLQRQFYKSSKGNLSQSLTDVSVSGQADGQIFMEAQPVYIPATDSSHSSQELAPHASSSHIQDRRYGVEVLQSSQQSLESSTESQQLQQYPLHHHHTQQQQQQQQQQQHQTAGLEADAGNSVYQQQMMRHESLTPTPDGEPLYVNRSALLPAYRPSPDYDMVMQQRIIHHHHHQQQQQQGQGQTHFEELTPPHLGASQVYVHPDGMAYSQPEISQMTAAYRDEHGNYANMEALRSYGHYANIFQDDHNFYQGRGADRGNNLAVHPTYSSPELNTELHHQPEAFAASEFSAQEALAYHFRPPPPYPRTSSSTPDLAGQASAIHELPEPHLVETAGPHDFVTQSRLDRSVDDLSVFQNFQQTAAVGYPPSAAGVQISTQQQQHATGSDTSNGGHVAVLNRPVESVGETPLGVGVAETLHVTDSGPGGADAGPDASANQDKGAPDPSSAPSSLTAGDLPSAPLTAARLLSDDQEDTSSEHSYSTFHAKDSDDSSEDDTLRVKPIQQEESKIQIRMFKPQEAPPPSKIKEEATLRESFRRLKIARASSLNREVLPGLRRSSLRGLKEATETDTLTPSVLKVVSEQTQELPGQASLALASSSSSTGQAASVDTHQLKDIATGTVESHEMKEILERLGAPPPYPGGLAMPEPGSNPLPSPAVGVQAEASAAAPSSLMNNNNVDLKDLEKLIVNNVSGKQQPSSSSATVKRSSSMGTAPVARDTPLLPPRREELVKPRSATYSLDTKVPISKPGMVLFHQDSEFETSVLKSEPAPKVSGTESDSESVKCLSEAGSERTADSDERDDRSEHMVSLQDYSMGSDSDSDQERGSPDSQLSMGPLKMAAMNGLTLSRSMVLSLMNDDSRAPKDDRRRMLESKISEGQVYAEFEQIPKKSTNNECNVARAPYNATRNRFKDVQPYDYTRVKLTPRKDNPDGYINASHIKLTANENKWLFIATQAPLENTAVDFWQMVWENQVDVLAMLTQFQELGKPKCYTYWPQEPGPEHKQVYGEFEVELLFTDDSLCYLTSRILVRQAGSRREHQVWHLQYTDWPDHGCPEDTYGFLGFLDEIESVSRLAETESGRGEKSPVVVHCSAGVGRTGVVILTMVMKWCLEHNHNVDLPKALLGIRNQRMHMVQTMGQYRFIHDTLIQYLKNTRLI